VINNTKLDAMMQDMSNASGLLDLLICSKGSADASDIAALTIVQQLVDQVNDRLGDEYRGEVVSEPIQPEPLRSPAELHAVS